MKRKGEPVRLNRREVMQTGLLGALSLVAMRSEAFAAEGEELVVQLRPLNSLDPAHQISSGDEGRVSILVNNALMRYAAGEDYALEPDLATGFEVSEDGKTYTFTLREGVVWHGGFGAFTAQDVKWSIERVLDPATKSRNAGQFKDIERIEVIDDLTVRFHLKAPSAVFPHAVATFRGGFMMSKAAAEALGEDYGKQVIGTGPFVLEKAELDREIVLTRNEDYFGEKPKLKRITFRVIREDSTATLAFERGQIDMIDVNARETADRFARDGRYNLMIANVTTGLYLLTFNTKKAPFDKKEVRQAIQYGIDKKAIVDAVYKERGQAVDTVMPPGVAGYTEVRSYDYDPERARKMLAEAGVSDLKCTLTVPTTYQREAVFLQAQLKQIGVTLDIQLIDRPTWFRALGQDTHDIIWNAHFRAPQADAFLYPSYHSSNQAPNGINCAFYSGVDDLIDEARVTFDDAARTKLYEEALKRIAEDSPAIPLTLEFNTFAVQKWVKDINLYRVPENSPVLEGSYIEK